MFENEVSHRPERPLVVSLLFLFSIVFIGFAIVGPLVGFFISLPFFEGSIMDYVEALQNIPQHPEIKISLYILQACATLVGLIVGPLLILRSQHQQLTDLFPNKSIAIVPVVITIAIVVAFMGVNSFFIEWNAGVSFPSFLKDFEAWAREREDLAEAVTKFLTHFDSVGEVLIAMLVIAILPAIGEELVFRGMIQRELFRGIKNIHVAIWISAALFSAIHMQFFGFVPRFLLGALFGYIYYWSGNLSYAMLGHFINNGFTVVGLYLNQLGYFDLDVESTESVPLPVIIFSGVLTITLLYAFKKFFQQNTPLTSPDSF